jgi:hypothetical protein
MYIVEREQLSENSGFYFYDLVGETEGLRQFAHNLGSTVLEAVSQGILKQNEAYHLLSNIQPVGRIARADISSLGKLIENETLTRDRIWTIMGTASDGNMSSSAFMQEFNDLEEFDLNGSEDIKWLTSDGLIASPTVEGDLETDVYDDIDSNYGEDSTESSISRELSLTTQAFQMELIRKQHGDPIVLSKREHTSLGVIDQSGRYQPVVTVLSDSHPAMQKPVTSDLLSR